MEDKCHIGVTANNKLKSRRWLGYVSYLPIPGPTGQSRAHLQMLVAILHV